MTISIGQVGTYNARSVSGTPISTGGVNTSASGSGFVVAVTAIGDSGATVGYTLSDTFGNTYVQLAQDYYGVQGMSIDRWYIAPGAPGYAGGGVGHQVTITPTTSNSNDINIWMTLIEMPGAATGNANFHGSSTSNTYPFSSSGPYASTSLSVSPPAGGAILVSCLDCTSPATGTGSDSTGFTTQVTSVLNGNAGGAIGTKAVVSSATYTPSWSWSTATVTAFSSIDSFFGPSNVAPIAWAS